jgi:hypothetical protein
MRDDARPFHGGADHAEAGNTAGVDLRGSSVPTNADDISMDLPEDETRDAGEGQILCQRGEQVQRDQRAGP